MKACLVQKVRMSDGVHLATDVWLSEGTGPYPVLLTRTPYHRAGAFGSARIFTSWGYAYVVQDMRGKYDSEGEFHALVDEMYDGHDTLDWIAEQKWCDGRIALVGKSYLGILPTRIRWLPRGKRRPHGWPGTRSFTARVIPLAWNCRC